MFYLLSKKNQTVRNPIFNVKRKNDDKWKKRDFGTTKQGRGQMP